MSLNQGYELYTPSVGGDCNIVVFAFNNADALIFSENYTETAYANSTVVFPTQFYRNSHLMWLNGSLLKPGTDYTMPGASNFIFTIVLVGALSFSGQPVQFISFNSSGDASTTSGGAAGVLGMDMPVLLEYEPTMQEMFEALQKQVESLKSEIEMLKGTK